MKNKKEKLYHSPASCSPRTKAARTRPSAQRTALLGGDRTTAGDLLTLPPTEGTVSNDPSHSDVF